MKKDVNYLDFIPIKTTGVAYQTNHKELVVLHIEQKGFFNRLAQWLFFSPKTTYIKLDSFGSYVWNQIDGTKSIYELGELLEKQFGTNVNPLYERLILYFQILKTNRLIDFFS